MKDDVDGLKARLKKAVDVLAKILPTWQGGGIKAEDVGEACELLKREREATDPPKANGRRPT